MTVGKVLGRRTCSPLEFWVAVSEDAYLQLDDVVCCRSTVPGRGEVEFFGVVESVEKVHEGLAFDTDVELVEAGILPVNTAYVAHVLVTRVEPELFVPPQPGSSVARAEGDALDVALYFDGMNNRMVAGQMRNGETAYLNYDFLAGEKGAHINISGISGVATKTSYALFLLYSLFRMKDIQASTNSHALVFNVKGEDLLYLDKPNKKLRDIDRQTYQKLGLSCEPFSSVAFYAPPHDGESLIPKVVRTEGVTAFVWSMREFAEAELFRYLFAEGGQTLSQLEFAVERITHLLKRAAQASPAGRVLLGGTPLRSLEQFADFLSEAIEDDDWFGKTATGTRQALVRRLQASVRYVDPLLREQVDEPGRHRIDFTNRQVTVVDIHNLHARAKAFVVGAVLKTLFEAKDQVATPEPRVYVVLDELNKYAPKRGWNPIKDILLDVAERGRSMGIILIGAQQTASEIEDRIVSNAAFRVAGRLDAAEGQKAHYGWLAGSYRQRAAILKPGTMIVHQPELPSPLAVRFPFPAWATRSQEVANEPLDGQREEALRKLLPPGSRR
ncbi:MAG: ATP-binding protein [Vulcanimicrobiota bacterium]